MFSRNTSIIIAVAMLLLSGVFFLWGGTNPAASAESTGQEKLIRVFGEAEFAASPDHAHLVLGVETQEEKAEEAVSENARLMHEVIAALEKMGLKDDQMETGAYQLRSIRETPQPDRSQTDEYKITYRASNTINITLKDDLKNTGAVIDTAVQAGANQVHSLRFELYDSEKLNLQALQAATEQAGAKAKSIAEGAGISIKGIKSISEEMSSYTPYRASLMDDVMEAGREPTPVVPGDVKVQARVAVEYYF